jgi:dTMP kinase
MVVDTRGLPRSVALVGIDGSGKTTQAHRLAATLAEAGVPARYVLNAGGRHWIGRHVQRFGFHDAEQVLGRRGMLLVEAVLRWLAIARSRLTARLHREVLVMDRYAVCQYASIRAHGGRSEQLARLAYGLFREPDVTVYLAVSPAEAHRRVEARGIDRESLGYLTASDAAYRSLPEFGSMVVVPADGTPDQVAAGILGALGVALSVKRGVQQDLPAAGSGA